MRIEVSSLFNQDEWKPVDMETFKRMVRPADEDKLTDMLDALKAGQCVLSLFETFKFRAAPEPAGGE